METSEIIDLVLAQLQIRDFWFTTKNDPTYEEPADYYKLDKYGDLTEKAQEQIAKEVTSLIGDGAIDIEDAIDLWINEACQKWQLNWKENLITKFEPKPVVPGIEAYTVKTESKITELYDPIESKLPDLGSNVAVFMRDFDSYNFNDNYGNMDEAFEEVMQQLVTKDGRDSIIATLKEIKEEDNVEQIKTAVDKLITRITEFEKELEVYNESKELKTESVKTRLKEENTKSLNVISQKFQEEGFDENSNEGQIVVRTSELFNTLSDKGFDVQVSFDNGESQSKIILGQQGANVLITITNANQPLKAFASGNFEITEDNVESLKDIMEQISSI